MGRLTLLFPDGGGQYRVVVKAIGFAPCAIHGIRQADEDRFVVNATLSTSTTTLCMVTIRGAQNNAGQAYRPTPGSTDQNRITRDLTAPQTAMLAFLGPVLVEALELDAKSVREAQIILTKEQRAMQPEHFRHPLRVFGADGRRAGPSGGGRS